MNSVSYKPAKTDFLSLLHSNPRWVFENKRIFEVRTWKIDDLIELEKFVKLNLKPIHPKYLDSTPLHFIDFKLNCFFLGCQQTPSYGMCKDWEVKVCWRGLTQAMSPNQDTDKLRLDLLQMMETHVSSIDDHELISLKETANKALFTSAQKYLQLDTNTSSNLTPWNTLSG